MAQQGGIIGPPPLLTDLSSQPQDSGQPMTPAAIATAADCTLQHAASHADFALKSAASRGGVPVESTATQLENFRREAADRHAQVIGELRLVAGEAYILTARHCNALYAPGPSIRLTPLKRQALTAPGTEGQGHNVGDLPPDAVFPADYAALESYTYAQYNTLAQDYGVTLWSQPTLPARRAAFLEFIRGY